jgi:hypothetical protein
MLHGDDVTRPWRGMADVACRVASVQADVAAPLTEHGILEEGKEGTHRAPVLRLTTPSCWTRSQCNITLIQRLYLFLYAYMMTLLHEISARAWK